VLGALNEQQHLAPRRPSFLLLARSSCHQKTFRSCNQSRHCCQNFLKNRKKIEGGHRALGSPRAGSVSAHVQGHSLLSLQSSHTFINMAIDKFFELKDM
jgi:hypothetical protein